jgi:hypothetical protein
MSVRYPFYELKHRRPEPDGSVRRCFHAADDSARVLFVWEFERSPLLQAQLLLGDETWVEWRPDTVASGQTSRAPRAAANPAVARSGTQPHAPADAGLGAGHASHHARHKGVRTLEPTHDAQLLVRARDVLLASNLPQPLVAALVGRLGSAG